MPASSEEVKFSDLEGMVIEAALTRQQVVSRVPGQQFSARVESSWRIGIKPENQLDVTFNATAFTPRGKREARPLASTVTLDEKLPTQASGGGERMWSFADSALTLMRTYPAGAYRIIFSFVAGPNGITCSAKEAFAREAGKGEIRLESPFGGGQVTIISAKQVASRCKVSKQKA